MQITPLPKKYKMYYVVCRQKRLRSSQRHSGPTNTPNSLLILFSNHIIYAHTQYSLHTILFTTVGLQYSSNFLSPYIFVEAATVTLPLPPSLLYYPPTKLFFTLKIYEVSAGIVSNKIL